MRLSTRAKIGIVTTLAVLILGGMIVWKGDVFLKARGYVLVGSFKNVGGLLEGSEVRYRGYKVGRVIKIIPGIVDTKIYMNIAGGIRVPKGSTLRVAFDGLIGQKYVEVQPSRSENVLKPMSIIKGYNTLGLVDFIDVGTVNLEELRAILESVRKVTDDPATQKSVKDALKNIDSATFELNKFVSGLNEMMEQEDFTEAFAGLKEASSLIVTVSERLDSITKSIDDLTGDPEFGSNLKEAAKGAKEAMQELRDAASDIRKTLRKLAR
jgi:phospholipid/cholesterol/gamma-HCH transport system substrate-binding protein